MLLWIHSILPANVGFGSLGWRMVSAWVMLAPNRDTTASLDGQHAKLVKACDCISHSSFSCVKTLKIPGGHIRLLEALCASHTVSVTDSRLFTI